MAAKSLIPQVVVTATFFRPCLSKAQSVGSRKLNRKFRLVRHMAGSAKFEVLTDGACPFCQWTRGRIEPFDTAGRLCFLDYNNRS